MADEIEPTAIGLSTMGGGLAPLVLRRYMPGKATKLGIDSVTDILMEPGIDAGLLLGVPSLGLALLGDRGDGPLAYKKNAIANAAALGGSALASAVGIGLYSLREQAEAAGFSLQPLGKTSASSAGVRLSRAEQEEKVQGAEPEPAPAGGGAAGVGSI